MHKNRNTVFVERQGVYTTDKVLKTLPVDQFPVKDFNKNRFGFPKSDVTILDELSRSSTVDMTLFNAFASRINVLRAEPRNNKTVDELIREFKPAWIQTVSEEMEFAKWYHDKYDVKPDDSSDDSKSVTLDNYDDAPKTE